MKRISILVLLFLIPRAFASTEKEAQFALERHYSNLISPHFYKRSEQIVDAVLLTSVCARHEFGYEKSLSIIKSARKNVLNNDEKAKRYLAAFQSSQRNWSLPNKSELNRVCSEVLK